MAASPPPFLKKCYNTYMKKIKLISWNVNGIRAWKEKEGVFEFIEKESPDIICFQETKAQPEQIEEYFSGDKNSLFNTGKKKHLSEYKYHILNSAEKKGYSSTAVFSKKKPVSHETKIKLKNGCLAEGRVITVEYDNFFLVNVYTPNSKSGLERLEYRYSEWDTAFLLHMKQLERKKPVIVCGDLNVAHQEIDLKNPSSNKTTKTKPGNAGFTDKERERFQDFISAGFIDTFRFLHPEEIKYSWFSYRAMARERNTGWRIDYFLTSASLKTQIIEADVHFKVTGSDHSPVSLIIKI